MRISGKMLADCLGAEVCENQDWVADGVSIDTRELKPGNLFIAVRGEECDPHDFLQQAKEKGAIAALVSRIVGAVDLPQILVEDPLECMQRLASFCRESFSGTVIAITGSLGKTTTREMTAFLLGNYGKVSTACKNFNNHIGLPFTILNASDDSDYLVLEMGMNHPGELTQLSRIAKPDLALITNVDMVHIENFGSLDAIAAAKAEIFQGLKRPSYAILDSDGGYYQYLRAKAMEFTSEIFAIGSCASDLLLLANQADGTVEFRFEGKDYRYTLSNPGQQMLRASMAALAIIAALGKDFTLVLSQISQFSPLRGRGRVFESFYKGRQVTVIDDSYNSSLTSLANALSSLRLFQGSRTRTSRKIAIVGDILELGKFATEVHAAIFDLVKKNGIEALVTVGEQTQLLHKAAKESGLNIMTRHFKNAEELLKALEEILADGDVVLIKGSNGMKLGSVVAELAAEEMIA